MMKKIFYPVFFILALISSCSQLTAKEAPKANPSIEKIMELYQQQQEESKRQQALILLLAQKIGEQDHTIKQLFHNRKNQEEAKKEEDRRPWYKKLPSQLRDMSTEFACRYVIPGIIQIALQKITTVAVDGVFDGADYVCGSLPARFGRPNLATYPGTWIRSDSQERYDAISHMKRKFDSNPALRKLQDEIQEHKKKRNWQQTVLELNGHDAEIAEDIKTLDMLIHNPRLQQQLTQFENLKQLKRLYVEIPSELQNLKRELAATGAYHDDLVNKEKRDKLNQHNREEDVK